MIESKKISVVSVVIEAIWLFSILWLFLVAVVNVGYFTLWLHDYNNPGRHELAIPAGMATFYSWPAGVGVLVAAITPKTGLSAYHRIGGIALALFCIIMTLIFDYFQAKFR